MSLETTIEKLNLKLWGFYEPLYPILEPSSAVSDLEPINALV